jgi:hypothetical protein
MKTNIIYILILICMVFFMTAFASTAFVIQKGEKKYIKDQTGEIWDVTQAESLGFKPEHFQYGIGKTAFTPLDDSHLSDGRSLNIRNRRVIGVSGDSEARAYSVPKLRYHEVANTRIGEKKIAVGY